MSPIHRISPRHQPRARRRVWSISPITAALLLLLFVEAGWAKDFAIGGWSDEEIAEHTSKEMADVRVQESDEGAVCLNHSIFIDTGPREHTRTLNKEFLVLDPSAESLADRHLYFSRDAEVEMAAGWIVRHDGAIVRLDDDDIIEREGDEERFTEVVLSFPNLFEGDVIGMTVKVKVDSHYPGRSEELGTPFRLLGGNFYLRTSGEYGYRIAARNFSAENLELEARNKERGAARLLLAKYRDIPARTDVSFPLPLEKSMPYLDVELKAVYVEFGGEWAWLSFSHWNQQAASAQMLANWWMDSDEVEDLAEELTEGLSSDREKTLALFDFVSREIETVDYDFSYLGLATSPKSVLADRKASANEKSLLLYAMMKHAELPALPAFIRSYHVGDLDRRDPTLSAFAHIAVHAGFDDMPWLWPARHSIESGELPPFLRHSTAFIPDPGVVENLEEAGREASMDAAGSLVRFTKTYRSLTRANEWFMIMDTGGNPLAPVAWTREKMQFDPGTDGVRVCVDFHRNDWESTFRQAGSEEVQRREETVDYLGWRWPDMDIDEDDLEGVEVAESDSSCRVVARVGSWTLPSPEGGLWMLPTKELLGHNRLDAWEGPDRGPMFVASTRDYDLEVRLPLPEGWEELIEPPSFEMRNPRIDYFVDTRVEGDEVVIERRLRLKAGTTEQHNVIHMDKDIERIRAFEATPLVLEGVTGSR